MNIFKILLSGAATLLIIANLFIKEEKPVPVVPQITEEVIVEEETVAAPEPAVVIPEEPEIDYETIVSEKFQELDEIKENKQEYLHSYKLLLEEYADYINPPVCIYDVFTEDEIYLMCRCIETETHGCKFDGKVDVAVVIINRLESDKFANTVDKVIVPGQFAFWREKIEEDTLEALEYAYLFGVEELREALFFQSGEELSTFSGRKLKYYDGYHWFY